MKQSILVAVLAVSVVAGGCGSLDMIFQDHYSEYEPTETQVLKRPWFTPQSDEIGAGLLLQDIGQTRMLRSSAARGRAPGSLDLSRRKNSKNLQRRTLLIGAGLSFVDVRTPQCGRGKAFGRLSTLLCFGGREWGY